MHDTDPITPLLSACATAERDGVAHALDSLLADDSSRRATRVHNSTIRPRSPATRTATCTTPARTRQTRLSITDVGGTDRKAPPWLPNSDTSTRPDRLA
jgi:hypothetical protein